MLENATQALEPTQEPSTNNALYRLGMIYGRFIYQVRWLVLLVWIVGLVISIPFAANLPKILDSNGSSSKTGEATQVADILANKLKQVPAQLIVVFQSGSEPVQSAAYQQEIQNVKDKIIGVKHVTRIDNGEIGKDSKTTYLMVDFDQNSTYVQQHLNTINQLLPNNARPAQIYLTGAPASSAAFSTITEQDVRTAEEAALPIALLVLLIVFGTLVAGAMPIVLALVALPVALATLYLIALHVDTSIFVLNIASVIGLGTAIDYSLLMVRRFRDELAQGRSVKDAVAWTVATAGEAIFYSGIIVVLSFCGLLLLRVQTLSSFGIGGMVVVASSATAALTLLPALFGVLGDRVNSLRVPYLWRMVGIRSRRQTVERQGVWHRLAIGVMRRPIVVITLVLAILLTLGWPIFFIRVGSNVSLPVSNPAQQGLNTLQSQISDFNGAPVFLVVQTRDGSSILNTDALKQIDQYTQWLRTQQHVSDAISLMYFPAHGAKVPDQQTLVKLYTSGTYTQLPSLRSLVSSTTVDDTTLVTVRTDAALDSVDGDTLIDHLRADQGHRLTDLHVLIGGRQASSLDFNRNLYGNFPQAILFIIVVTYVLLLIMFRSVLLPLKAVIMNVLSLSVTYGVLVLIFQWGFLQNILGFQSDGFIVNTVPVLMFCILFGLSMDYEMFLLSRVREEWLKTGNNREAVARGMENTGSVITSAAFLFVLVTGAFTFTSLTITKEIGLGMTIAVIVDATIIRSLLVPATMRLMGKWNWWFPTLRIRKHS